MNRLLCGDSLTVLRTLADNSVDCVVTSPPYWGLRDYGVEGQIGLEPTFEEFLAKLVAIFEEVRRVLKPAGTCWVNMGDCYTSGGRSTRAPDKKNAAREMSYRAPTCPGLKPKDIIGQPWRLAFALQACGWYLRQDIIWHKPSAMPESVTDRCTKAHEYLFLLTKSPRYFFDAYAIKTRSTSRIAVPTNLATQAGMKHDAVSHSKRERKNPGGRSKRDSFAREQEPAPGQKPQHRAGREDIAYNTGANCRSVWTIASRGYKGAHFATFPLELAERCIKAGCPASGVVLDHFGGSGTVAEAALLLGRQYILIEINPKNIPMQRERLAKYPILTAAREEVPA